jgi:hypothetical protein
MIPCSKKQMQQDQKTGTYEAFQTHVMAFLKKIGVVFMLLLMFGSVLIR